MSSRLSPTPGAQPVTLDSSREAFFLAQRANERFSAQLSAFVDKLQEHKPDTAWLEEVRDEAARIVTFHQQQHDHWAAISSNIDEYVAGVKALAEQIAVNELKGEETAEAELPENKAKTLHPELVKFQLEKKAKILGKIGGIPALGPGAAAVLPALPRGQILKATASPAAREIYYSKVEDKDAAQLAGVFQFQKGAKQADEPAAWQEEATAKSVRRASDAVVAEQHRQEEQERQLSSAGGVGAELAGALRQRQQALKGTEQEEAEAAASSFRRVVPGGEPRQPRDELSSASPELAQALKRRQEAAAVQARRHSEGGDEAHEPSAQRPPRYGGVSASADGGAAPAITNELASVLQKLRANKAAAEAAERGAQ